MLLINCSKEEYIEPIATDEDFIYLDSCIHSYLFNPGSYWIYEDSLTFYRDSLYLKSVKDSTAGYGTVEVVKQEYFHSQEGNFEYQLFRNRISKNSIGNLVYKCDETEHIDTLTSPFITFYNVKRYYSSYYNQNIYYKEGVGIVRAEKFNPPIDTGVTYLVSYNLAN